jgi:hypothetical protein
MGVLTPGGSAGGYGFWMQAGCWRLLRTSFSGLLDDVILVEYQMDSLFMRLIFLRLIHVSTLSGS